MPAHSPSMFAVLIIGHHLSISALCSAECLRSLPIAWKILLAKTGEPRMYRRIEEGTYSCGIELGNDGLRCASGFPKTQSSGTCPTLARRPAKTAKKASIAQRKVHVGVAPPEPDRRGSPSSPRVERICCRAGQVPGYARRRIMEVDRTIYAILRHRFDNYRAEAALLRRRHGRPIALGPAHSEGLAVGPPADIDATRIRRQRPVFPSIGSSS
jgi:hypothetical protein